MRAEVATQRLYEAHDLPDLRTRTLWCLARAWGLGLSGGARAAALQRAPDMWGSHAGCGTTAQTAHPPVLPTTGAHPPQGLLRRLRSRSCPGAARNAGAGPAPSGAMRAGAPRTPRRAAR